jgi:hypothetical protein
MPVGESSLTWEFVALNFSQWLFALLKFDDFPFQKYCCAAALSTEAPLM